MKSIAFAAAPGLNRVSLPATAAHAVSESLAPLPSPYEAASLSPRALSLATSRFVAAVPDSVLEQLARLRYGDLRLLVLFGMFVPTLPAEPQAGCRPAHNHTGYVPEWALLACLNYLGVVMAIEDEAPRFVTSLFPDPGRAEVASNFGYRTRLPLHTEAGFLGSASPDFVGLFCLREDAYTQVPTLFADIAGAFRCLSLEHQLALERPDFALECPPSFAAETGRVLPPRLGPVASGTGDGRVFRYKAGAMSVPSQDLVAQTALRELDVAIQRRTFEYVLQRGELALMSANRICHGRVAYEAASNAAQRRWLLRSLAIQRPFTLHSEADIRVRQAAWSISAA